MGDFLKNETWIEWGNVVCVFAYTLSSLKKKKTKIGKKFKMFYSYLNK